jgi:hypothetical protein
MLERSRFLAAGVLAGVLSVPAVAFATPLSCGMPENHPRSLGPSAAALRERSGLPPLPGAPNYFGGGCARPAYSQTLASGTLPITIHYEPTHAAMATKVLQWAEESWDLETRSTVSGGLEFPPPAGDGATGGGSNRMDFYLEPSQFGGYYCPELYVYYADAIATSGFISINPELNDDAFTSAAVAHELHHAIQFGLDAHEDAAFMEMTSAYVMEAVFDTANASAYFINEFQAYPHYSLDYFDYGQPYQYGASLFLFWFLDGLYGGGSNGHDALRYLWLATRQPYDGVTAINEPDSFDTMDTLLAASSMTFTEAYEQFAGDRWFTGANDDGTFEEGSTFNGPADAETYHVKQNLPDGPFSLTGGVAEYGAAYVVFDLDDSSNEATLDVSWDLGGAGDWAIYALRAGVSNDRSIISRNASDSHLFTAFEGEQTIVLAFVNLGDGSHDPDNDEWAAASASVTATYDDPAGNGGGGGGDEAGLGCSVGGVPHVTGRATGLSLLLGLAGALVLLRKRS